MIPGGDRMPVIRNIRDYAQSGEFYHKVELHDPVLTPAQSKAITDGYMKNRRRLSYRMKRLTAVTLADYMTGKINRNTAIVGLEKIPADPGGLIITSNHFSPFENTAIRYLMQQAGLSRLNIISQTSNFAMNGVVGFLMNYADTIPISVDPRYLSRDFMGVLREKLVEKRETVLLYPEQEMWFNYRKPRPPKKGAYYYAAKLQVPVLSCFVEIVDTEENESPDFKRVRYVVHVLGLLYSDPAQTTKENAARLAEQDYALKKACYEQVYGKSLSYAFDPSDIAGWQGDLS